jgi:hypothetical protein
MTTAVRGTAAFCGATLKVSVALPTPLPTFSVTQPTLLVAVQAQPAPAISPIVPVPPAAGTV